MRQRAAGYPGETYRYPDRLKPDIQGYVRVEEKDLPELRQIPFCAEGELAGNDGHIYRKRHIWWYRRNEYAGNGQGKYKSVNLRLKDGSIKNRLMVHRIVCETYNGSAPTPEHDVSHEDGDWTNNRPDNLKWRTCSANLGLKLVHGTYDRGERSPVAALTDEQANWVREQLAAGLSYSKIAKQVGVSATTIGRINRGLRYKPVTEEEIQERLEAA